MANTLEYAEYLTAVKTKASEIDNLLNNEFGFKLNEVLQSYASLFNRFCPYKVGDRVQLKETLDIPEDSGWYSRRHFLIKGAIATVREIGYRNDLFSFGLVFDDESYIHYQSKEVIPISDKGVYYLSENEIEGVQS